MKNKNKILFYIIVAVCVVLSGVVYTGIRFNYIGAYPKYEKQEKELTEETEVNIVTPTAIVEETPKTYVYVHVCGSVNNPGLYCLVENSRVKDAVDLAGGFTDFADETYVNLARTVKDGERIYIPSLEETESLNAQGHISGTGFTPVNDEQVEETSDTLLVNINTASASELTKLPGIGESKANDIINYRIKVGLFQDIKDIMNVSGIGQSLFDKIKDFICI